GCTQAGSNLLAPAEVNAFKARQSVVRRQGLLIQSNTQIQGQARAHRPCILKVKRVVPAPDLTRSTKLATVDGTPESLTRGIGCTAGFAISRRILRDDGVAVRDTASSVRKVVMVVSDVNVGGVIAVQDVILTLAESVAHFESVGSERLCQVRQILI